MENLYSKVKSVLSKIPETRNSDITLTIEIWKMFYGDRLVFVNNKLSVYLENLYDIPREDSIKRIRAKIQNEEKQYLPTSEAVAKQRGLLEKGWRKSLGYPSDESVKEEAIEEAKQKKHLQGEIELNDRRKRWNL